MEQRVLIVNEDGLLSSLPTVREYNAGDYDFPWAKTLGVVLCHETVAALIYKERARVRVSAPGLPEIGEVPGSWLYIAVVNGSIVLL